MSSVGRGTTPSASIWLPSSHSSSTRRHALIYFLCGNPGFIEFYRDFLSDLRGLIDGPDHNGSLTAYDIYGRNLPGFSDDEHEPFHQQKNPPLSLESVIETMYEDVARRRRDGGGEYDEVILMGHSVGTFIGVEIFHRHLKEGKIRAPGLKLSHGFLLFPTVTHLALSPAGRRFTFLMKHIPLLDRYAHIMARFIVSLVPIAIMELYISNILGFTRSATKTTAGWLKSRDGVWQTLSLAKDEMKMIAGEERWGEEIWEVERTGNLADDGEMGEPRFFMFYAKNDHWIADEVRDEFRERMRRRGEEGGGRMVPRIEMDEGGRMKHDFCTREDMSFEVAKRVSRWVSELEGARKLR